MQLGSRKPVVKNIPGGNKILMDNNIGDATIKIAGTVYAASYGNSPESIYKWTDPTKTSVFTEAQLPQGTNGTGTLVDCICYDSVNNLIYCGYRYNDNGTSFVANIAAVNPSTLASIMLVNEYILVPSDLSVGPDANNGIATDGTYIYYAYGPGPSIGGNAIIVKFKCVDGSFVSSFTLPNTGTGSGITTPRTLSLVSGVLYVTGADNTAGYAATVATDFSSSTAIATAIFNPNDDIAFTSTSFWEGDEASTSGFQGGMCKTALDLSSTQKFFIPLPGRPGQGWVDSVYYDGTYLWVSLIQDVASIGNPSQLVKIEESTFTIVERYVPGVIHINEIQPAGAGFWLAQYNGNNSLPSTVQFWPIS